MEKTHHVVIELRQKGFMEERIYLATLDELRAKGWKPTGSYADEFEVQGYELGGSPLRVPAEEWDAKGSDAWVSTTSFAADTKITFLH